MAVQTRTMDISVSADNMSVYLDCELTRDEVELRMDEILVRLKEMGVYNEPDKEDLQKSLIEAAQNGQPVEKKLLVKGVPPTLPENGKIEWAKDFFGIEYKTDEKTGAVNFWERKDSKNVEDGDLLATLLQPVPGEKGIDIFGKSVAPPKPGRVKLTHGAGVKKEETDGKVKFFAVKSGKIRYTGNKICVDDVYQINGDVSIETGNIDHNGAVIVTGNVRENAKIRAQGSIEVHGNIEPADIHTNGSLTAGKGITGSEKHAIEADGGIQARYILNAHIQCSGDITVEKEIIQSSIRTKGSVTVTCGRIVGGSVIALGEITAVELGSDNSVHTEITAGVDVDFEEFVVQKNGEIVQLNKTLEKIHAKVDPLMARQKHLRPKQKEAATELLFHAEEMEGKIRQIRDAIDERTEAYNEQSKPFVTIEKKAYPKAHLTIREFDLMLKDEIKGPVRAECHKARIELKPVLRNE